MLGFTLLPCPFCGMCPFSTVEIRWFRRFSYSRLTNSGTSFFVGSIPPVAEISVLCLVCVVFVAPRKKPCRCGDELYFWCVAFYHSAYCFVGSYLRSAVPDWLVCDERNYENELCSRFMFRPASRFKWLDGCPIYRIGRPIVALNSVFRCVAPVCGSLWRILDMRINCPVID